MFFSGVPLVLRAETFLIPSARIAAIAAPRHVALQPHSMPLVVSLLKTFLANNACGVFLACLTFPGDITMTQSFRANTLAGLILLFQGLCGQFMIYLTEQELLALVCVLFEVPFDDFLV